jgi:hypothetical protein
MQHIAVDSKTRTQDIAGQLTAAVDTSGGATTNQVLTGKGRLQGILVTTVGTGVVTVYDGTSTAGTIVAVVPASQAVGWLPNFPAHGVPVKAGLFVSTVAAGPKITLVYVDSDSRLP